MFTKVLFKIWSINRWVSFSRSSFQRAKMAIMMNPYISTIKSSHSRFQTGARWYFLVKMWKGSTNMSKLYKQRSRPTTSSQSVRSPLNFRIHKQKGNWKNWMCLGSLTTNNKMLMVTRKTLMSYWKELKSCKANKKLIKSRHCKMTILKQFSKF